MNINFNTTSLNTGNYRVSKILHDHLPTIDLESDTLANNFGVLVNGNNLRPKVISIEGRILNNSGNLEDNIDSLKELFNTTGSYIELDYQGASLKYDVILSNFSCERDYYHNNFALYKADFLALKPTSYIDSVIETLTATDIDETTTAYWCDIDGNYSPFTNIYYTIDTVGSLYAINCKNLTTNEEINIGTVWSAGDVINIDTENKIVYRNSSQVDYEGVFPTFNIGSNQIKTTIDADNIDVQQLFYNTNNTEWDGMAQSFKPATSTNFNKVALLLAQDGTTDFATLRIETSSGGLPTGTLVSVNATKTVTDIDNTTPDWVDFEFPAAIALTAGTTYCFVLSGSAGGFSSIRWYIKNSNVYANGSRIYLNKGSWAADTGSDYTFKLYKEVTPNWHIDHKITYKKRYL